MIKIFRVFELLVVVLAALSISNAHSKEYLLEADIDVRAEYNDNIFLTNLPHDSTKGIFVTPALSGIIKEENWEGELRARIRSERYSDDDLNCNDQLFYLTGRYLA